MVTICHVKTIREDLYLLSVAESDFHESKATKLDIEEGNTPLFSCTLSYKGNGTVEKLEIEFSEFLLKKDLGPMSVPTISIIKNGLCKVMHPIENSKNNTLKWKGEIDNSRAGCVLHNVTSSVSKCDLCSIILKNPFSIDILIDFILFGPSISRINTCNEETLNSLSSILADVTFKVGDQNIRAHSPILSAKSQAFAAMFQQNLSKDKIILVEDIKPAVFRLLLQYLYGKRSGFQQDEILIPDLLLAAEKYGVESLKEECSTILKKKKELDLLDSVGASSHSALNEPFTLKGDSQVSIAKDQIALTLAVKEPHAGEIYQSSFSSLQQEEQNPIGNKTIESPASVSPLVSNSQLTGSVVATVSPVVPSLAEQILEFESVFESVTNSKAKLPTFSSPKSSESPDPFIDLVEADELISMSPPIKNDVSCTGHFRSAGSSKSVSEQSSLLREVLGVYQVLASPKSYEEIGNQSKFILNTTATQDKAQYNKQSISPLPLGMSSASLTPLRTTASLSKEFQEAPVHISANSTSVETKPLNLPDEPVKLRGLKRLMSPNTTINLKRSLLDVGKLKPRRVPEEMTPLKNAIPGASQSPGFIKLKTGTGSVPVKLMNGASKSPSSTVSAIPLSTSSGPVNFQEVKLLFVSQPGVNKEGKNTLQMNMLRSGTDDRLIALHSADGKQTRLINIGSARLDNSTSIHVTINSLLAAQPAAASNQQGQKLFPSVIDSIKPIDAVSAMLPEVSIVLQQQNGENRIDTVRNTNECDFDIAMSTIGKEKCRSQNALLARKNVTVSQAVPCTVICPQISNSKKTVTLRCATPKEKVVPGSVSKLMTIKDAERIGTYSSLVENQSPGTIHH